MLAVGRSEDRALQGWNPSAEPEAGAGEGVKYMPSLPSWFSAHLPLRIQKNRYQPRHNAINPGDRKPSMG